MATANYEFQSDFARRYIAEGRAEGKAEGKAEGRVEGRAEARLLLRLIDRKGIVISEHDRERVLGCTECEQLEAWADRVLTATTRDDIFES